MNSKITPNRFVGQVSAVLVPLSKTGASSLSELVPRIAGDHLQSHKGTPSRPHVPIIAPTYVTVTEPEEGVIDATNEIEEDITVKNMILRNREPTQPPPPSKQLSKKKAKI